ncbi:MAG TPA: PEGA domain-containing protein [Polyangiaceae bacterium]|nr:PEGA domain-containing protein [Polyangiaceae bacterium]
MPDEGATPDDARALGRKGDQAQDERRYDEAVRYYEQALRLVQVPALFFNAAQAYEMLGRYPNALDALLRFKAAAPPDYVRQRAPDLDKRIAVLRNKVTALTVNTNVAGARVFLRDTVVGAKPADKPLRVSVNAGHATVEVNADGYNPYRKEVDLPAAGSLVLDVQLTQRGDPKPSVIVREVRREAPATPFWSQWWFWAGAGVLIVGGATTVYAMTTEKDAKSGPLGRISGPLGVQPSGLGLRF